MKPEQFSEIGEKMNVCGFRGDAFNSKNSVPAFKHGGGSIMLRICLAASVTSAFER